MSETAFTPGPWVVDLAVSGDSIAIRHSNSARGAISGIIARAVARRTWRSEAESNANLIAAAPDLYEACAKTYLTLLTTSPEPWRTHNQPILCALRDALAKAEGVDGEALQDRFEAKARGEKSHV